MKTNILTTISDAAETAGYNFCYGDGRYFEQAISQLDLAGGAIGLMLNINSVAATMERDMWNGELVYDINLFMFRKSELNTFSSVQETQAQKFENRLDELQTKLIAFITSLTQCSNIDLISPRYSLGYNITAANADGWFLDCSLRFHNQFPM